MEEIRTISQVTKMFGISTRTLRYYEQINLLQSERVEGYSYRVYGLEACQKLQKIIILRKLRIPLKQIASLLDDQKSATAIKVFIKNIEQLNAEIESLSTIRSILLRLLTRLKETANLSLNTVLITDETLKSMVVPLSIEKINLKEENTMEDLNQANEKLGKLTDRDIRIIQLPKAVVAAYQYEGDDPEWHVNQVIDAFVREHDLVSKKPDLRHYGFNSPNPVDESGYHGYEMWVTVPEDMEIPAPLVRKEFAGGLYAAYMIPMGAFEEWSRICDWIKNHKVYEYNGSWDYHNMFGWMEEHLNYVNHVNLPDSEPEDLQLDLLMPIKKRETVSEGNELDK